MALLIPLIIVLISLLTFLPSFHIGLYGDDWLAIFRYVVHIMPPSKEGWNYFTYYLTPYGSQDIIMGLLYQNFGTNAFYYEVTAYTFRLLAAFSLYPVALHLTKSKLATFFAVLFFSITTIGLDSTGWLLTMPTYLTIAFINIFLYFYLIHRQTKKVKFLILSGVFFYLAYITTSARVLGAPLFMLSLEAFWLFKDRTKRDLRHSLLRIIFIFIVLLVVKISGPSLGNSSDWFQRLSSGLTTIQDMFNQGRSDFILNPIVTIGGMFIPNFSFPNIQINTKNEMLMSVVLPSLTFFLFLLSVLKANTSRLQRGDLYKGLIAATIWIFIVFIIRKMNLTTFSGSNLILMAVAGGLAIIVWLLLLVKYQAQKNVPTSLFISFSQAFFFFFLAWLWSPSSYIDSTHRYLTVSAVGISILFATIISLGKKFKNQLYLAAFLSLFLILHIISTRVYINKLSDSHSQQKVDKIWSSIPYIPEVGKEPLVFYFEGDNSNRSILGDSVLFGFTFHIALLYNLTESDKIPASMTEWKEVVSAVTDGQSFKPYGYPLEPIPISKVYGFRLHGKDNLINITDLARQKLVEEVHK